MTLYDKTMQNLYYSAHRRVDFMRPTPPQEEQVYRLDPQMTDPQAWKRCWMGNQPAALRCSYHDKRRFFVGHLSPMKFSAIVRHKKRRKRPQCLMVSHFAFRSYSHAWSLWDVWDEALFAVQLQTIHWEIWEDRRCSNDSFWNLLLNVFVTCQPIHYIQV